MRPLAAPQAPPRCSGLRGACPVATSPRGCRSQAELLSLPCRRPPPPWTVQAAQEELTLTLTLTPNPNPNQAAQEELRDSMVAGGVSTEACAVIGALMEP